MVANLPEDIANEALDASGSEVVLGDMQEGTREGQVVLRKYSQCLRQLLRAAHWDMARKQASLFLLADATGQTADVGQVVPTPWVYEYAYPEDCMKARFVPVNNFTSQSQIPPGNISIGNQPLLTGIGQPPPVGLRLIPSRFLVANDFNYPNQIAPGSNWWEQQGVAPGARTVVLSNVKQAMLIYTAFIPYPSLWDPQFRAAMVAYLASEIALPLAKDKKFGMQMRATNIAIAKEKIMAARVSDGNEGFFSSDISVDWMRARNTNGWGRDGGWGWNSGGIGCLGYGWDSCAFADGSAF